MEWYHNLRIILSVEDKLLFLEQPIPAMPVPDEGQVRPPDVLNTHTTWVKASKEIVGLMLMTMDPDIQKNFEHLGAYDMLTELKMLYEQQADQTVREFHACKQEEGYRKDPEKPKKKSHKAAKGNQGKGKEKMGYAPVQAPTFAPKPKNPPTHPPIPKKDNPAKDVICHQCGEVGVEAIGEFHLCLPSGLVLILHNCHYAPSITRGIVSVSRLYKDGFVNRFENDNSISVSKNNLIYFNAIPRDDIYEIVLSNTNDSSMYAVSNKRAKLNLDSALLWHCRLGHINKKRIEKLQHDGLLDSTDIKSFEKCVACMSGKMARKPYSHQVERAKDLLGLIHTDVCGPFKIMSRQGASYFVTFTDDFSHYGYVYLLKHKHEVFETFKVFQKHGSIHDESNYSSKVLWDYALESAARILNMVPTKKVDKTPYEIWHAPDQSMKDNQVWDLFDLPPNGKTVVHKCSSKRKNRHDELYTPIKLVWILIAIVAFYDYEIWQMDVKNAFLNGYLNEEVYMEQPEGFVSQKFPNRVCKLKRSIYGLKQASRQWNKRFDDEIKKFGFSQNHDEPCVYVKASRVMPYPKLVCR
ncbi:retrotransposon protein, putative, ty1-copia subclass [Tanacetum coccineum]